MDRTSAHGYLVIQPLAARDLELCLRETTVAAQPVVKSGDRLMIIFETQNLRLTAPGMSLQKGALGDRIQVRNLQSKILVYATVRDKNHVQVN